jgi:hypothetical protein
MSTWFSITMSTTPGSLAVITAALADEKIAIEGLVGSPESGEGVVHLAVADDARERALVRLAALGVSVHVDEGSEMGSSGADGLIGAILNGPRT